MAKYRKKPVVVEAIQLTRENAHAVAGFLGLDDREPIGKSEFSRGIVICTLEGNMLVSFGDYVIKGVKGEVYPCKPDIFAETYELIEG